MQRYQNWVQTLINQWLSTFIIGFTSLKRIHLFLNHLLQLLNQTILLTQKKMFLLLGQIPFLLPLSNMLTKSALIKSQMKLQFTWQPETCMQPRYVPMMKAPTLIRKILDLGMHRNLWRLFLSKGFWTTLITIKEGTSESDVLAQPLLRIFHVHLLSQTHLLGKMSLNRF